MVRDSDTKIPIKLLGQAGCRLHFNELTIYTDPYLSNSVQVLENPNIKRMIPIPVTPENVKDADWVLISHDHIDHCDPLTLPELAEASPGCRFVGPEPVIDLLKQWGIERKRLYLAEEKWQQLSPKLRIHAIPAAHPAVVRKDGRLNAVGYLFEYQNRRIYFAGDTGVTDELLNALKKFKPYDTMLLPVNEQNFFRDRNNIIGNMSVREAFLLAEEMQARQVIPLHWDMFAENAVYLEEMEIVYKNMQPAFQLVIKPESL